MSEYFEILRLIIERQPKSIISKQSSILSVILLKAFDLRRIQCTPRTDDSYDEDEILQAELLVNSVTISMIYKLNDAHFRPIFAKMIEWVTASTTKKEKQGILYRRITWYTFLHTFFDALKV